MPCVILAFVIANLVSPAAYVAILNKTSVRKWSVHIVELIVVDFNSRALVSVYPGFRIGHITVINCNIGTVIQHNTKIRGVINFAVGYMHIAAIVKGNTICSPRNGKTADGNIALTVVRNRSGRRVSGG